MAEQAFRGHTVAVTGAAQGIGLGIATRFGELGAQVVIADIHGVAARRSAGDLCAMGIDAIGYSLDVRDPDASHTLVDSLVREHGDIDVWVNNAGVSHLAPAERFPIEDWRNSLDVMLSGTFYCSQAAGRHMLERGSGVIVNVASVTGYMTSAGRAAYSSAKAGVVMLTQTLGIEWAARGVRVVGVAPSVTMTDMARTDAEKGELNLDDCVRRTPLGRLASVEEVADAVVFLASDEASYIVAETLRVDGGWLAYQLF